MRLIVFADHHVVRAVVALAQLGEPRELRRLLVETRDLIRELLFGVGDRLRLLLEILGVERVDVDVVGHDDLLRLRAEHRVELGARAREPAGTRVGRAGCQLGVDRRRECLARGRERGGRRDEIFVHRLEPLRGVVGVGHARAQVAIAAPRLALVLEPIGRGELVFVELVELVTCGRDLTDVDKRLVDRRERLVGRRGLRGGRAGRNRLGRTRARLRPRGCRSDRQRTHDPEFHHVSVGNSTQCATPKCPIYAWGPSDF